MISTAMFGKSSKRTNIPKFVIQYGINKKFPMTRTVSEEKIVLKNPKIDFKGNKVYLESNYQFSSPERKSKGKLRKSKGKIRETSSILVRYNINARAVLQFGHYI